MVDVLVGTWLQIGEGSGAEYRQINALGVANGSASQSAALSGPSGRQPVIILQRRWSSPPPDRSACRVISAPPSMPERGNCRQ